MNRFDRNRPSPGNPSSADHLMDIIVHQLAEVREEIRSAMHQGVTIYAGVFTAGALAFVAAAQLNPAMIRGLWLIAIPLGFASILTARWTQETIERLIEIYESLWVEFAHEARMLGWKQSEILKYARVLAPSVMEPINERYVGLCEEGRFFASLMTLLYAALGLQTAVSF